MDSARTTWYFAEGDTGVFDTYLALANAGSADANATITFFLASGQTVQATYVVPASGRQLVHVNTVPGLGQASFGMAVQASSPIAAERTMFFTTQDTAAKGGHASSGVVAPARKWYLAEGQTGSVFSEYLLLANPNTAMWHDFGMEWKEHVAFLAPMAATVVAFVVSYYGPTLAKKVGERRAVMIFFILAFATAAAAGLFGAFITKAAPVH